MTSYGDPIACLCDSQNEGGANLSSFEPRPNRRPRTSGRRSCLAVRLAAVCVQRRSCSPRIITTGPHLSVLKRPDDSVDACTPAVPFWTAKNGCVPVSRVSRAFSWAENSRTTGARARTSQSTYRLIFADLTFPLTEQALQIMFWALSPGQRAVGREDRDEQERWTWGGEEPCHVDSRPAYFALRRNRRPFPRSRRPRAARVPLREWCSSRTLVATETRGRDLRGLSRPFARTSSCSRCWQLGRARLSSLVHAYESAAA